ncbi:DUF4006 family protein [Cytobacillus sp. Hz8]
MNEKNIFKLNGYVGAIVFIILLLQRFFPLNNLSILKMSQC